MTTNPNAGASFPGASFTSGPEGQRAAPQCHRPPAASESGAGAPIDELGFGREARHAGSLEGLAGVYARVWIEDNTIKRRLYVVRDGRALKLAGGSADGSAAMPWCDVADFDERPGQFLFVCNDGKRAPGTLGGRAL